MSIVVLRNPIRRFNLALLASATAAVLCAIFGTMIVVYDPGKRLLGFHTVQLCAALGILVACLTLPRRPAILHLGFEVDGQYTVSALQRYTFAWSGSILHTASTMKDFGLQHIPLLHFDIRSENLSRALERSIRPASLLRTLLCIHLPELVFQLFFVIAVSVVRFSPQIAMYALLRLLEQRETLMGQFYKSAWLLVAALGFSMLLASWGDAWIQWVVFSRLSLPLRSELSIMIFKKAMRKRHVTAVASPPEITPVDSSSMSRTPEPRLGKDELKKMNAPKHAYERRQGTINLIVSTRHLVLPWRSIQKETHISFRESIPKEWQALLGPGIYCRHR